MIISYVKDDGEYGQVLLLEDIIRCVELDLLV
jgi:hypothetical protein